MPDFSVVAVTTAQGSDEAEYDVVLAEFDDVSEAKGYARRIAEESHRLAAQLNLDFDYSQVSIFNGEVDELEADAESETFVGMWFYTEEGADWADAAALRAAREEPDDEGDDAALASQATH